MTGDNYIEPQCVGGNIEPQCVGGNIDLNVWVGILNINVWVEFSVVRFFGSVTISCNIAYHFIMYTCTICTVCSVHVYMSISNSYKANLLYIVLASWTCYGRL